MATVPGRSEILATTVLGSEIAPGMQLRINPPVQVTGIDNTLWTAGVNPAVIANLQKRVTTIVMSQDPPAGTEVPFGTPVNITVASLDNIPLNSLKNTAGLNFNTLGDFQTALAGNAALMTSVSNAASFQALSATDQASFTTFATQHGATDASAAFGAAKIVTSL